MFSNVFLVSLMFFAELGLSVPR